MLPGIAGAEFGVVFGVDAGFGSALGIVEVGVAWVVDEDEGVVFDVLVEALDAMGDAFARANLLKEFGGIADAFEDDFGRVLRWGSVFLELDLGGSEGADDGGFGAEEPGFGGVFGGFDAALVEFGLFLVAEDAMKAVELANGGFGFGSKFKGPLLDDDEAGLVEAAGLAVVEGDDVVGTKSGVAVGGELGGEAAFGAVALDFVVGDRASELGREALHDLGQREAFVEPVVELGALGVGEGADFGWDGGWFHGWFSFLVRGWLLDFGCSILDTGYGIRDTGCSGRLWSGDFENR